MCNSELRSFQLQLDRFRERQVEVVAVSIDSSAESQKLRASQGYTFPFLSDPDAAVIRRYGVLHARGGENGRDIARPAEFLVDAGGTVRWTNLSETLLARLRPETALRAIDALVIR
jgi:peroxiredoxin Q/BCP